MIIKLFTLDGIRRTADKSISLRIETVAEQTTNDMLLFDEMFKSHILVAIKPEETPFTDAQLNDLSKVDIDLYDKNKSPSKRFRNVLWILCKQQMHGEPTEEKFAEFYKIEYERIIQHYKDKLE